MHHSRRAILIGVALLTAGVTALARQQNEPRNVPAQQPPIFRSGVDLVAVDVQVVSADGVPVDTLGIDDFQVAFDGHPRKVVSVDFMRKAAAAAGAAGADTEPTPVTRGVITPGARIFVIAIDATSVTTGTVRAVADSAAAFVRQLAPDDVVALYVQPFGRPIIDFTHDHLTVAKAIERVIGQYEPFTGTFHMTVSEIIDIAAMDGQVLADVAARECEPGMGAAMCKSTILSEARAGSAYYEMQGAMQLRGISVLLEGLAALEGRKTVLLLSGGMPSSDRVGGRPSLAEFMTTIGAEASAANANVYAIHLDNGSFDVTDRSKPGSRDPSAPIRSQMRDANVQAMGLDRLAATSGGALFRDPLGTGAKAFDRVLRETSGYYLLAVQPLPEDRDGKLHYLRVTLKKRGLTVRSRTQVVIARAGR